MLATAPRSEIVELLDRHRVDSLPVVDVEGRLLGVVRYQTLFESLIAQFTALAVLLPVVAGQSGTAALLSFML